MPWQPTIPDTEDDPTLEDEDDDDEVEGEIY